MARRTRTGILAVLAHCKDCDKEWESKNALMIAAQHTDRTGHETYVEETRIIIFGGKDK